ncbi:hypothetical protein FVE85_4023 [Porphyridium purpureum]|uniref:Uncharacterized protein n=1 Tax=Porphyridium purpureum TaxID=35688 RepID=A0A5J4YRX3_PORPP|nr:hypothetical protein FVE85_4023 [Porphyridium purpureum]|eukprot:POR4657..scf229_5
MEKRSSSGTDTEHFPELELEVPHGGRSSSGGENGGTAFPFSSNEPVARFKLFKNSSMTRSSGSGHGYDGAAAFSKGESQKAAVAAASKHNDSAPFAGAASPDQQEPIRFSSKVKSRLMLYDATTLTDEQQLTKGWLMFLVSFPHNAVLRELADFYAEIAPGLEATQLVLSRSQLVYLAKWMFVLIKFVENFVAYEKNILFPELLQLRGISQELLDAMKPRRQRVCAALLGLTGALELFTINDTYQYRVQLVNSIDVFFELLVHYFTKQTDAIFQAFCPASAEEHDIVMEKNMERRMMSAFVRIPDENKSRSRNSWLVQNVMFTRWLTDGKTLLRWINEHVPGKSAMYLEWQAVYKELHHDSVRAFWAIRREAEEQGSEFVHVGHRSCMPLFMLCSYGESWTRLLDVMVIPHNALRLELMHLVSILTKLVSIVSVAGRWPGVLTEMIVSWWRGLYLFFTDYLELEKGWFKRASAALSTGAYASSSAKGKNMDPGQNLKKAKEMRDTFEAGLASRTQWTRSLMALNLNMMALQAGETSGEEMNLRTLVSASEILCQDAVQHFWLLEQHVIKLWEGMVQSHGEITAMFKQDAELLFSGEQPKESICMYACWMSQDRREAWMAETLSTVKTLQFVTYQRHFRAGRAKMLKTILSHNVGSITRTASGVSSVPGDEPVESFSSDMFLGIKPDAVDALRVSRVPSVARRPGSRGVSRANSADQGNGENGVSVRTSLTKGMSDVFRTVMRMSSRDESQSNPTSSNSLLRRNSSKDRGQGLQRRSSSQGKGIGRIPSVQDEG